MFNNMKTNHFKLILLLCPLLFSCDPISHESAPSPFEYREVYLPQLASGDNEPLHLNSVDHDWGIWGHNLSHVLPQSPSPSVYAKSGNSVNREQFCFSSDALFGYIKDYIKDNFGTQDTMRFAILPNDNQIVCQCSRCAELGNTADDCSAAVYYMLERLTEQFPKHIFFTSYYRTTKHLPERPLPHNAGVLISAMDFPLCPTHTPQEDEFMNLLVQWSGFTERIYIWDYINNFDDYLTPFPIFDTMQRRLQLYVKVGVKGVFLNGSGPDYSTFYRIKTHVLSALLSNPDVEWRPLLRTFCRKRYPVAGQVISDFVIMQEDRFTESGKTLPMYEGVSKTSKIYLYEDEFLKFHRQLINCVSEADGKEHQSLEKINRALMFPHLELKRLSADMEGCQPMLDELGKLSLFGYTSFSEAGASLDQYITDYRYILHRSQETKGRNLLKGINLLPLTALDEDYSDISILTDGLLGLPSCYHCGQMLSSATPALRISIPHVPGMKRLRVNMTRDNIFHIAFPQSLSLSVGGREVGRAVPKPSPDNLQRSVVEFQLPEGSSGPFVLSVFRDKEERTMALDEIEGF